MKNEKRSQSFMFNVPALYFSQKMFFLRDKLITHGEKREKSTQNLQRNNVARQVEGFEPRISPPLLCTQIHMPRQTSSAR